MAQGNGSIGAQGHLLAVPLLVLGKSDFLAPVVLLDMSRFDPVIEEDSFFLERFLVLAKPSWKHKFSAFESTLYGTLKHAVTKEHDGDPWSRGLYDYEEYGGGLSLSKKFWAFEELSLGGAYSRRSYPNYHYRAPSGAKNYYVKDQEIGKFDLEATFLPSERGQIRLAYSLDNKAYTDAYYINPDGTLNLGTLRSEQLHQLSLRARKAAGNWARGLQFDAVLNQGNQNSFDYLQNIFFEDFYSYRSFSLKPELSWLAQGKPDGHRVSLSYEGLLRDYAHRSIRTPGGAKTQGVQADVEHRIGLDGVWVSPWWGVKFYLDLGYRVARSNQAYEPGVKYSYDLFTSQAGLAYRY
jgi:hypothetical protein